ncbi:MAG: hypothetical protein KDC27_07190 [Acidobacteria bacterium]|nr:hypothetical protein [Acidobacteriota bacterium]
MSVSVPPARTVLLASASPEAEAVFFRNLFLPTGAYKTTFPGRFHDLDAHVCALLEGRGSVRALDIGVSSGVTTLEWIDALEARGLSCQMTAADLVVHGRLTQTPLLGDVLTDGRGRFLQLAGPLGVRMRPYRQGVFAAATAALDLLARQASAGGERGREVQLVTPRLTERANCEIVEHDALNERPEWRGRFDVARAANLLNRVYFSDDQIRQAIGLLRGYLAPGGLLVLCRTDIETRVNHASILRLEPTGKLSVAERLGEGSEIEALALS